MRATLLVAALGVACAGAPVGSPGGGASGRPDWVGGTPARFPAERFVTGVGVAEERAAAEARARAAVAAVFETRVAAATKVREEEVRAAAAGKETVTSKVAVSQEVVAATTALLEGAAIAAAWTDPQGQVHALAVLDRAAAAAPLKERLAAGDASATEARARLQKGIDRATAARLGYRILSLLASRDALAVRVRALEPAAEIAPPAALAGASEAARLALGAPLIRIDATGPNAPAVGAAVSRALVAVGLGTQAQAQPPEVDLVATVAVEEAEPVPSGAWTIARATARVRLERAGSGAGEAWAELSESAKGTATQPAEAGRRAATALAKQVEERLAEALRKQLARP